MVKHDPVAAQDAPRHVYALLDGLWRRAARDTQRLSAQAPPIEGLRGSVVRILGLIPPGGARPTALAEGAWITKQSLGERIREMEQLGWVTVTADEHDGRGRIVRRTERGDQVRAATERTIASMEAEWAAQVGPDRFGVFLEVLAELAADDGGRGDDADDGSEAGRHGRTHV